MMDIIASQYGPAMRLVQPNTDPFSCFMDLNASEVDFSDEV